MAFVWTDKLESNMMKDYKTQPVVTLKLKKKLKSKLHSHWMQRNKRGNPIISDGDALEMLLNTISILDAIESQCIFHAKDKT